MANMTWTRLLNANAGDEAIALQLENQGRALRNQRMSDMLRRDRAQEPVTSQYNALGLQKARGEITKQQFAEASMGIQAFAKAKRAYQDPAQLRNYAFSSIPGFDEDDWAKLSPLNADQLDTLAGRVGEKGGKLVKAMINGRATFVPESMAAGLEPFSQPLVSINTKEETAEATTIGGFRGKRYGELQTQADSAASEISTLRLMRNRLQQGLRTGAVEPFRNGAAAFAESLGLPVSPARLQQVADSQSFNSLTYDLLRNRLAAQKGPQTEGDAERMLRTLASLDKVEEANDFIVRAGIALRTREVEQADFWARYREKNGDLRGVEQAWRQHKERVPLFGIGPDGRPKFFTEFVESNRANHSMENIEKVWNDVYAN